MPAIARLVGFDEEGTFARLQELRRELIDPQIEPHQGLRIVKPTGYGMASRSSSPVWSTLRAARVQGGLALRNAGARESLAASECGPTLPIGDVLDEEFRRDSVVPTSSFVEERKLTSFE